MKTIRQNHCIILFMMCLFFFPDTSKAQTDMLAKPSEIQYKWHEQERIMFVALDPCSWQGREYDNHSTPLARINSALLNTDQWCEVAKSWGAREILYVAKHTGGFCWWHTQTSEYGIKNTPYKNGQGDVLKDLSASCKKYGLNLGIYVYPGDDTWGAGIGSGGKTKDPSKQEAYNQVFRQQLTEVLSLYGKVIEVWFDGSCVIKVDDILNKYASKSVIFQGPKASLRWPGTESGKLYYPAWNSLKSSALKTGISTQYDDDPDGDAWAPLEADVTLYNHNWFWSPLNEKKRREVEELMDIYYKSVGHGGVLLLNSTPDTTGLIPVGDVKLYVDFGKEISRRFDRPLATVRNKEGNDFEISFKEPTEVNHVLLMEDYRQGHRIREYVVEGWVDNQWKLLSKGSAVGRMKIDAFPTIKVLKVRLQVTKNVETPLIRSFSVYGVENYNYKDDAYASNEWKLCGSWDTKNFTNGTGEQTIDLSPFITRPGQYEVTFTAAIANGGVKVTEAEIYFDGDMLTQQDFIQQKSNTFYINRTAQVAQGSSSIMKVKMSSKNATFQNRGEIRIRERSMK